VTEASNDPLKTRIEAILFATDQPVSARRIAEALGAAEGRVRPLVDELRAKYDADGHAFTVEEIAGGYQILTRSEYGDVVKQLFKVDREHKLSQAALETIAIIAYKQPIIRAEIEDIRGVQVQDLLRSLMEQGLVRIVGRAESLGHPLLYGTTHKFLLQFGLKSAKDLPPVEDLKKRQ
jgi:segregation and condensation protein B